MDEKVEQITAKLMQNKYADVNFFHYGRSEDFDLQFTRHPKELFAPYSSNAPYTDSGSFQSRKYFTRPDYIIQNPNNGGMQIRGQIPRVRPPSHLN